MALIWVAPAWLVVNRTKTAATFVGVGFWFGYFPDIDLYLQRIFATFHHHGIFHTVFTVSLVAAVVGPLLGRLLGRVLGGSDWFSSEAEDNASSFGFLMVWIPGLSHIFADMLSAPDIAQAVEPFWPLYQHSIGIDVVYYDNRLFNWGLLLAGIGLNIALYWYRSSAASPSAGRQ